MENISFANETSGTGGSTFGSINVSSLRSALNQCKNAINYSYTKKLCESVQSGKMVSSSFQQTLQLGLIKLRDTRYGALERQIDKYLSLVENIDTYKAKKQENENLESQYNSLSGRLYYDEERTKEEYDDKGEIVVTTYTVSVMDYSVDAEMKKIKKQIEDNKTIMENNLNTVKNGI